MPIHTSNSASGYNLSETKAKTSDIFKTEKFTRSFEKACQEMFEESLDELYPDLK